MKKLLIIGRTFPEPYTTAAGKRMMQLVTLFRAHDYAIAFASSATLTRHSISLENYGVKIHRITLNCTSFDFFIQEENPDVVLFDRYISEEHFGWRVAAHAPEAIRILDTEDLHFLREARAKACSQNISLSTEMLYSTIAKREIASILRSDLSLIISSEEMKLLIKQFNLSPKLLFYMPFLLQGNDLQNLKQAKPYVDRWDFISVGNFLHKPNRDAVRWLKQDIWPKIRKKLPQAKLHVYGAYAPDYFNEMHNEKEGFIIRGWAADLSKELDNARVCLAPLRFGAGLKGKLFDAMLHGLPVVTTPVGAEGMYGACAVPGIVAETDEALVHAAVDLYSKKALWEACQANIKHVLETQFLKEKFDDQFRDKINYLQSKLKHHRKEHFIGQILLHDYQNRLKYMSMWIAEKNKH